MAMDDIRGIEFIKDMSKDDLIDEIQAYNRKTLAEMEISNLKGMVIESRVRRYKERLEKEAGIQIHQGFFGAHVHEKEEE